MRSPLYNDDFENYLQQQVKQHRMYPSDRIWRSIQNTLHGEFRWPALTIISIFIIATLTVGTILIKPNDKLLNKTYHSAIFPLNKTVVEKQNVIASQALEQHISPDNITQKTLAAVSNKLNIENSINAISQLTSSTASPADNVINSLALSSNNTIHSSSNTQNFISENEQKNEFDFYSTTNSPSENKNDEEVTGNNIVSLTPPLFIHTIKFSGRKKINSVSLSLYDNSNVWRSFPITNQPAKQMKTSKFVYQVYVTPSASYRRLVDDKSGQVPQSFIPAIPAEATYNIDVNQVVRHRPALGMEVGFAIGYKLTKQITLKTGLQYNMRQYDIDAYGYKNEPASVALVSNSGPDTLNTFSTYTNYPGSYPITLKNRYYEISMPVGVDWRILNSGKFSLVVAASVQPTYTFDKQPFIITSDYKNYADGSSLMRKWNINTNLETYFSYKMNGYALQIGPQFRYQQLPTLSSQYPIREYLLDYGIKVGFSKAIK
ncbi:MAG: outer membrane beta-barrel protein [Chitinophagaceae bacterium]